MDMKNTRNQIIPLIILLSVYIIPLFFDNNLLNVNVIHFLLFTALTFFLSVSLIFRNFSYFINPRVKFSLCVFLLFLLFIFISSEINDRLVLSFEYAAVYLSILIFSYLLFLSFQLFDREKLLYYISLTITVTCVLVSLLGILEFYNIFLLNFNINSRPGSTLGVRNFASEYAVTALPFIFIFSLKKNNLLSKIFSIFSFLVVLTFIFFCRTRSAYILLLFYALVFTGYFFYNRLFVDKKIRLVYLSFISTIIVSFLIGSFTAPNLDKERISLSSTIESIVDGHYSKNEARINYWKTSIRIFRDVPITGIGTGSWSGIYPVYNGNIYTDENILQTSELNPHNDYLKVLSENGIFGFAFFVLFLLAVGRNLFNEARKNFLIVPVLLSFCGFLIISLFSFPGENISIICLAATAIGISFYREDTGGEYKLININIEKIKIFLLGFISLILLVLTIYSFYRYRYEKMYIEAIKEKANSNYTAMVEKINGIDYDFYPLDPNRMPVEYYRGIGYFELKNYNEALNSFDRALELTPMVPAILNNKASALYMMKDNENAVKLLNEIKIRNPFLIESQINLLAIYSNSGNDSLAKALLNEIDNKPLNQQVIKNYNVLGNIKAYYNEKKSN